MEPWFFNEEELNACIQFFLGEIREHNREYHYVTNKSELARHIAIMERTFEEALDLRRRMEMLESYQ